MRATGATLRRWGRARAAPARKTASQCHRADARASRLRGKSQAKVRAMLGRLDAEMGDFRALPRACRRCAACTSAMCTRRWAPLSNDTMLRHEMAAMRAADRHGAAAGRPQELQRCASGCARTGGARAQADEIQQMLRASYQQLNAEFGFRLHAGRRAAPGSRRWKSWRPDRARSMAATSARWRPGACRVKAAISGSSSACCRPAAGGVRDRGRRGQTVAAASTQIDQQLRERQQAFAPFRHERCSASSPRRASSKTAHRRGRAAGQAPDRRRAMAARRAGRAGAGLPRTPRRRRAKTPTNCRCAAGHPIPPAPDIAQRVLRWRRQFGRQGLPWQDTRPVPRVAVGDHAAADAGGHGALLHASWQRFPDLQALADAPLDEVLALGRPGLQPRAEPCTAARRWAARAWRRVPGNSDRAGHAAASGAPPPRRSPFCFGERAGHPDRQRRQARAGTALGFGRRPGDGRARARAVAAGPGSGARARDRPYTRGRWTWAPAVHGAPADCAPAAGRPR